MAGYNRGPGSLTNAPISSMAFSLVTMIPISSEKASSASKERASEIYVLPSLLPRNNDKKGDELKKFLVKTEIYGLILGDQYQEENRPAQ